MSGAWRLHADQLGNRGHSPVQEGIQARTGSLTLHMRELANRIENVALSKLSFLPVSKRRSSWEVRRSVRRRQKARSAVS